MGYWTHFCWAHQKEHDHTIWYFRDSEERGREFICDNEFNGLPIDFKKNWEQYHQQDLGADYILSAAELKRNAWIIK